jgi:hypothetical protein
LLDGVIADVLSADVVSDILGVQSSLAVAIGATLDLADGLRATSKSPPGDTAVVLNQLFAQRKLPAARLCLIDRVHRQLRSASPLYPHDSTKELGEFRKLVERLLTPTGLYSGAETAEALTGRFSRMSKLGSNIGAAIDGVFRAMPDRASGVLYLCDLARSDYANEHLAAMAEQFAMVSTAETITDLCQPTLSAKDRMIRATNAYRAMASSPYPSALKKTIAALIDGVLEHYLVDQKIIEKLDDPNGHLRDRALRLVHFCAAGVLPEGKALTRARERTLALLRQPDFNNRFIEGITDPAVAQKALREFHTLLITKGGFGG